MCIDGDQVPGSIAEALRMTGAGLDYLNSPAAADLHATAAGEILTALGVIGKQVHDARLVAVCHVHKVTHLLTFNISHFVRMAGFAPGVVVVDPVGV